MTEKLREEDLFALYSETKAQAELVAQSIEAMRHLVGELRIAIPAAVRDETAAQLASAVLKVREQLNTITSNHQTTLEFSANKVVRAVMALEQMDRRIDWYKATALLLACVMAGAIAGAGAFYYLPKSTEVQQAPIKVPPVKEPTQQRKKDRQ